MKQERTIKGLGLSAKLLLLWVVSTGSALLVVLLASWLLLELSTTLLLVSLGAFFFSMAITVIASRKLRKRLQRLSEVAARIQVTDLSVRVDDSNEDQIGQIGRAIDRMASALEEPQARITRSERLVAIGQLGASVAHELRNPMGAIVTSLALIDDKLARKDTAIEKHLAKIKRNTEDANRIISDLLTYARVKEPQRKSLSVTELFDAALLVSPAPIAVKINRPNEEKWPRIYADKDQLIQVVSNLLINAYQALEEQGVISLSASEEKGHCIISVEDNGPGVPEEKRRLIFEPLVTSKAKGTGLGLALCYAIVRGHRGEIEATTSSLGGAKFIVRLPKEIQ